ETVDEVEQRADVRKELERGSSEKPAEKVKAETKDKFWFVTHALIILGCIALYLALTANPIPLPKQLFEIIIRFLRTAALVVMALAIAKAISVYVIGRIEDATTSFT